MRRLVKLARLSRVSHNCKVERSEPHGFFLSFNKTRTITQFKTISYIQHCIKSQLMKNRWSPEHAGAVLFVSLVEVGEERFGLSHLLAGCH